MIYEQKKKKQTVVYILSENVCITKLKFDSEEKTTRSKINYVYRCYNETDISGTFNEPGRWLR